MKILTDDEMRELGFTDRREGFWYKCYSLVPCVTLNLTMDKKTGYWEELVMDELFGQPEYYGMMNPKYRDEIIKAVDNIILNLKAEGLPFEVDHRAYGVKGENE